MKKSKSIDNIKEVGERIRLIRKKLNLNQSEFAEMIGLANYQPLSKYEKGDLEPPLAVLLDVAKYGKTTVDWLLTGVEEKPAEKPRRRELSVREDSPEYGVFMRIREMTEEDAVRFSAMFQALIDADQSVRVKLHEPDKKPGPKASNDK